MASLLFCYLASLINPSALSCDFLRTSYGMCWDLWLLPDVCLEALVTNGMFSRRKEKNRIIHTAFCQDIMSEQKVEHTRTFSLNLIFKVVIVMIILHFTWARRTDWIDPLFCQPYAECFIYVYTKYSHVAVSATLSIFKPTLQDKLVNTYLLLLTAQLTSMGSKFKINNITNPHSDFINETALKTSIKKFLTVL